MRGIHRRDLLRILIDKATPHSTSHFSKKLASYEEPADGPIQLSFTDGTTATCDLLVGSDGVKSSVRAAMYKQKAEKAATEEEATKLRSHIDPIFAGMFSYRYMIRAADLEAVDPTHPVLTTPIFVSLILLFVHALSDGSSSMARAW